MTCQIERVNDELLYPNFGIAGKFVLQNSWIGLKGIGYRMKMENNFLNEQDGHFCGQVGWKDINQSVNCLYLFIYLFTVRFNGQCLSYMSCFVMLKLCVIII